MVIKPASGRAPAANGGQPTRHPLLELLLAAADGRFPDDDGGFTVVPAQEKDRLLRTYWSIPARQIETSVVLADGRWVGKDIMR